MGTLTLNFTAPTPPPANGYVVKYRKIGDPNYTIVSPNPTTVPIVITGVDNTKAYEGTVTSLCTTTFGGSTMTFSAGIATYLKPFDYLVIRYKNNTGGLNLNSFTGLVNTGTAYDINYGSNTHWVGDSEPSTSPYLTFAGNNTTNGGEEAVMVNFPQFLLDFPSPRPTIITIRLHAWWYDSKVSGNTQIEFQTWLGGTVPILDSPIYDLDKGDGNQVDLVTLSQVVTCTRGALAVNVNCAQQIFQLVYNTQNKSGYIIPITGGCGC